MVKRASRQVRQLTEIALLSQSIPVNKSSLTTSDIFQLKLLAKCQRINVNWYRTSQQQLCLKTLSIHNYLQLAELKRSVSDKNEPVILIARITPIMLDNPEDGHKLLNELYLIAKKNNYSIFRLGEERIILAPIEVQVKKDKELIHKE